VRASPPIDSGAISSSANPATDLQSCARGVHHQAHDFDRGEPR